MARRTLSAMARFPADTGWFNSAARIRRALCAAAALFACAASLPARGVAQSAPLAALVNQYLTESEQRDPLFADSIGVHAYDDRLPDLSPEGQQATYAWEARWRARFAAVDESTLNPGERADRSRLIDGIDADLLEAKTLRPYATDPSIYTGAIGDAVYQLTSRQYAPLEQRLRAVARRLALVPDLVRAAEASLSHPSRVSAELAVQQNQGNIDLYQHDLPSLAKSASPETQALLQKHLPVALASLRDLQAFLSGPLLAQADGNPRVGAAVFDAELRLVDGTDTPRDVLVARARADFESTRKQMRGLAWPLYRRLIGNLPANFYSMNEEIATDVVVRPVLDRLASHHAAPDQILTAAKADVAGLTAFLRDLPVVPLPDPDTLHVVPTPEFQAGVAGAGLDSPGPFTPLAGSYYYIDRIPSTWTPERIESYLREYNDYEMRMLSLHEAVPGHYVQFRYNALTSSLVRRVWPNGSFVEGWAVYTEGMMLDAGYGKGDPALRLFQLKWRLREYANAIIDAEYHTGTLTKEECFQLLGRAFQESSEMELKWHRLELSHDQLSSYFVGLDAIEQARRGYAGSVTQFNRKLLDMGSVEPRFIGPLLGQSR
jgi:hypothetical protein